MRLTRALSCAALLAMPCAMYGREAVRPKITNISGVTILVSDLPASREAYKHLLAPRYRCDSCEDAATAGFELGNGQIIALQPAPSSPPGNLVEEVFLQTDDLKRMKSYLASRQVKFAELKAGRLPRRLQVADPDGHHLSFVQSMGTVSPGGGVPLHLIHAGFVVRNRADMEHFYRDILGFRPYWHGGMKDDQTDWVSLQVPDGTDWVEFMVNVPENADQRLRGIMNHIALGVPDIQAEREQLVKNGVHLTEEPKLGRDGKWQLNLYDPDQTRIEFMEFTPKEKPCCSEFTGSHPKP